MKQSEKPIRLEDVELMPRAMERLERAAKTVFAHPPAAKGTIKGAKRRRRQSLSVVVHKDPARPYLHPEDLEVALDVDRYNFAIRI